jgi:glycosyltransferase involved in cell wall biosynthesis
MAAVGDAVTAECESIERGDPRAFVYRGTNLRFAAERALYIRLANNRALAGALRSRGAPVMDSPLEAAVARRMLGRDVDARRMPSRARIAAAGVRARLRRPLPLEVPPTRGGCWFLVNHEKFLRFIAPITEAAPHVPWGFVSLSPAASAQLAAAHLRLVAVESGRDVHPPSWRALGPALRSIPDLAVELDRFERLLGEVEPERLILIEGVAPTDEILNQAAKRVGVPAVCLQQGWSPVIHPGFRNTTFTAMGVWGEGFRDLLSPASPSQPFLLTGSHMLECEARGSGIEPLTNGRPAVAFFLQGLSPVITEKHLEALFALLLSTADALPGAAVIVREHPSDPLSADERSRLEAQPNVVLAPPTGYSLRTVLDAASVTVSTYSTTLVESAALGKPPVIFGLGDEDRYTPDLAAAGAGIQVADPVAALRAIKRLIDDPAARNELAPGMRSVRERFFAGLDGGALDRVVALARGNETVCAARSGKMK